MSRHLKTATTTLYLVDPEGNRYTITTFALGAHPDLIDWSGDGSHALFKPQGPRSDVHLSMIYIPAHRPRSPSRVTRATRALMATRCWCRPTTTGISPER